MKITDKFLTDFEIITEIDLGEFKVKSENVHRQLDQRYSEWFQTGSSTICNPQVTENDFDFVCFKPKHQTIFDDLFLQTSDPEYEDQSITTFRDITTYRINLIVPHSEELFHGWYLATKLAKEKNILNKEDRINFFIDVRENPHRYLQRDIDWV